MEWRQMEDLTEAELERKKGDGGKVGIDHKFSPAYHI